MPKGPLGGPRPFSKYRILINPHEKTVKLFKVGPFGGPRPFAKNNPPVADERVAECMLSESGQKFGAGVVSRGGTKDIGDLPPEARQEALELAEKYCRGTLEASSIEDMEEGNAIPRLTEVRSFLESQTGAKDDVTIETAVGEDFVDSEIVAVEESEA